MVKEKKNLIDKQKSNRSQSLDFETTKKNIIYTMPKEHQERAAGVSVSVGRVSNLQHLAQWINDDVLVCKCHFLLRFVQEVSPLRKYLRKENMKIVSPHLSQILSLGFIMPQIGKGKQKGKGESFNIFLCLQRFCHLYDFMYSQILIYVFQQQTEQK